MVDQILALTENQGMMLMAPVVRATKGDLKQELDLYRAQGYVRARIDGKIVELSNPFKLSATKKHDIDIVIDRFKVRPDVALRLTESLETALHISDGTVLLVPLVPTDTKPQSQKKTKKNDTGELAFSNRYACTDCGYSMSGIEPKSFSFNSPQGACPDCDGLGSQQSVDMNRLISDESLSLASGAVVGWDKKNKYYYEMLCCLGEHYGFDVAAPFSKIPKKVRNKLFNGSGSEKIKFTYTIGNKNDHRQRTQAFEGIIPNINRRYRETESATVREELTKLMSISTCSACDGERLNQSARNVLIEGNNISTITKKSIRYTSEYFCKLKLKGQKKEVAEQILFEINQRLGFLVKVGLDYLSLSRSAATLSGGEAQRIRLASQIGAGLMGVMYVLDEPSIGLHQRDNSKLIETLLSLKQLGNLNIDRLLS